MTKTPRLFSASFAMGNGQDKIQRIIGHLTPPTTHRATLSSLLLQFSALKSRVKPGLASHPAVTVYDEDVQFARRLLAHTTGHVDSAADFDDVIENLKGAIFVLRQYLPEQPDLAGAEHAVRGLQAHV